MIKSGRSSEYRDRDYAIKKAAPSSGLVRPEDPKAEFERRERSMRFGFQMLCKAVAAIKDKCLYKAAGYATFEECCEQRWGWSRQRGYQLAAAEATMEALPENVNKLFTNEGQVRALATVKKEDRAKILKQVASKGQITAKAIQEAARPKVEPVVIDVEPEPAAAVKHCPTCVC